MNWVILHTRRISNSPLFTKSFYFWSYCLWKIPLWSTLPEPRVKLGPLEIIPLNVGINNYWRYTVSSNKGCILWEIMRFPGFRKEVVEIQAETCLLFYCDDSVSYLQSSFTSVRSFNFWNRNILRYFRSG